MTDDGSGVPGGTGESGETVRQASRAPAASCSQIRSGPWPGVARDSWRWLLAAVIVARHGLMLPRICRQWLPSLAPLEFVSLLMFEYSNSVADDAYPILRIDDVAVCNSQRCGSIRFCSPWPRPGSRGSGSRWRSAARPAVDRLGCRRWMLAVSYGRRLQF